MSAELVYRVRPQGAEDLRKIAESLRATDDAVKKAASGLRAFDDSSGKVAATAGRTRAAIEANTAATIRLTDALANLKIAQASSEASGLSMASSIGLSTAAFSKGISFVEQFVVGLKDLVVNTASLAEAQANTAVRTGLTIKEVGLFEAVAEDAGIAANAYTLAMRTLSAALSQNDEEGKKAKRALKDLGVEVRDSDDVLRPMSAIWIEMAGAIGNVEDPARRARLAIDILGRGALEILPQLNSEFANTLREYERMGVGFDDASAKTALAVDNAFDRMWRRVSTFGKSLAVLTAELAGFGDNRQKLEAAIVQTENPYVENLLRDTLKPAQGTVSDEAAKHERLKAIAKQRAADEASINASLARQETLQEKLSDARKRRDEAAKSVDKDAFDRASAEMRSLEARIDGEKRYKDQLAERHRQEKQFAAEIERLVKSANDRDARRTGQYIERAGEGARRLSDSTELRDEMRALELRTIAANERILGPSGNRLPSAAAGRNAAFLGGIFGADLEQGKKLFDLEREHRLRMIELTAGPGGELAAAREIYRVRIEGARTELERQEARVQFEERIAALAQERLRKYEETAGRVYDSLKQGGGGGLRDFGRGQLDILQRQIFVNASSSIFQRAGGVLGKIGEASGLGGLLRGTIFDPANAQPIDKNTLALQRVSTSLDRLNGAITGTPTVFGGDGSYSTPAGVLQGGTGLVMSLLGRGRGGSSSTNVGGIFGFAGGGGGGSQQLTRNQRIAGGVGAAALGAYGIYSGIQQGGTGGAFTAVGGALGAASAIPGPQQPFLQGAALVMGFLGSIFGANKAQKYEEKQARLLDAARYSGPTGRDVLSDGRGGYVDYDYRGNVRVIERPVYVQVQAMDSRSFIDARQDIASAVREAIREGSDLSDTVRDLTMPR